MCVFMNVCVKGRGRGLVIWDYCVCNKLRLGRLCDKLGLVHVC